MFAWESVSKYKKKEILNMLQLENVSLSGNAN